MSAAIQLLLFNNFGDGVGAGSSMFKVEKLETCTGCW
jgi:hypothetical protein